MFVIIYHENESYSWDNSGMWLIERDPWKNIRLVGNKPLIAGTINTACKSDLKSGIVVPREDQEIGICAYEFKKDDNLLPPAKFAEDISEQFIQ